MTRDVQNEAIIGTKAARHLEGIDQFRRARHMHGDGLVAHLCDIDPKTETSGAMTREFDKAFSPQSPREIEACSFGHGR
ncbi:MAG: hypothetical protein QOD94_2132 [Alphaproteobacteria bacterium]|nr:hypothetical protein [Alphaproteobacteria bacterium]